MNDYEALLEQSGIQSDYKAVLVRGVPQNPMFRGGFCNGP